MMTHHFTSWVFVAFFLLITAAYSGGINPKLSAWFKSCQEKTGASDADYELIKTRKIPSSKEGTCMVECLFTKLHIIENGRFNKRGFVLTFSPILQGDFKKLSILKEIADICHAEMEDRVFRDGCNVTRSVLECFGKNKDKLSI